MNSSQIQLKIESVLNVPLHSFVDDFTFIVNGEEFKTSKIISDLISPKVCKNHLIDPTNDKFVINTHHKGNFSHILDLINFNKKPVSDDEIPFLFEIIKHLGNDSIEVTLGPRSEDITIDNVIGLICRHERNEFFYSKPLQEEINFLSSHFYEIFDDEIDEDLFKLSICSLEKIFGNPKLKLRDEDQLITIINELYSKESKYAVLYSFVYFSNVGENKIEEFVEIYNISDITQETWSSITRRLTQQIQKDLNKNRTASIINRYKGENKHGKQGISFFYGDDNRFSGIINHLKDKFKDNIDSQVIITASSIPNPSRQPRNVIIYDDKIKDFISTNESNPWICFDFNNYLVIPTHYIIRSGSYDENSIHPKSWVVEGSNDNQNWDVLDEQTDSPFLNGKNRVHAFAIEKDKSCEYRYIRMRLTGENWCGCYHMVVESLEFYGTLI